eukprot:TRINITY_DN3758_c0_g1_i4.p1 TRINITY_DN3758_c0_g1~~TRINITY_DN3758_c0_g1_i4.p1  ORF type:complete len:1010 (-),score=190.01 TRINITY_DN3758_c0_g1_i4:138-3167(-)
MYTADHFKELLGVYLLPLSSGEITSFGEDKYIIATEYGQQLMPLLHKQFISYDFCVQFSKYLVIPEFRETLHLEILSKDTVKSYLDSFLNREIVDEQWLFQFWGYMRDEFRSKIEFFQDYKLIPLVNGDFEYLKHFQSIYVQDKDNSLHDVIIRLGIPELRHSFVSLLDNLDHSSPRYYLTLLLNGMNNHAFDLLSVEQCEMIILYFSERSYELESEELDDLKKLPIFIDVEGNHVSLDQDQYYIYFGESLFSHASRFFLEPKEELVYFYMLLGVKELTESEIFVRFIFPRFNQISISEIYNIMEYIKTNYKRLHSENHIITEELLNLSFIPIQDKLLRANDFFIDHPLWDTIFGSELISLPTPYSSDDWIEFLSKININRSITGQSVLKCAYHIEEKATDLLPDDDLISKSVTLMECIKQNYQSIRSTKFDLELSRIRFIPTKYSSSRLNRLSTFEECTTEKEASLVWTIKPIFPDVLNNPIWSPMITYEINVNDVEKHLLNLTEHSLENYYLTKPPKVTYMKIIDYLNEHWDKMTSQFKEVAKGIPFILIQNSYVSPPSRSFWYLPSNYPPFMYQIPTEYAFYHSLLNNVDVHDFPSVEDMNHVFRFVSSRHEEVPLNPNEFQSLIGILRFYCEEMSFDDGEVFAVVPLVGNTVAAYYECYVDDIHLFGEEYNGIHIVSDDLPQDLIDRLGIPLLSSFLEIKSVSTSGEKISDYSHLLSDHSFLNDLSEHLLTNRASDLSEYDILLVDSILIKYSFSGSTDIYESRPYSYTDTKQKKIFILMSNPHRLEDMIAEEITSILTKKRIQIGWLLHSHLHGYSAVKTTIHQIGRKLSQIDAQIISSISPQISLSPGEIIAYEFKESLRYGKVISAHNLDPQKYLIMITPHESVYLYSNSLYRFGSSNEQGIKQSVSTPSLSPPEEHVDYTGMTKEQLISEIERMKIQRVRNPLNWITCKICAEYPSDLTLIPCGHVVCKHCIERWNALKTTSKLKCPFCRKTVKQSVKLFF